MNAAHFRADLPVAPGSFATLFGDFGPATSADGLEVLFDGTSAPLLAVAPGQINLRVPATTTAGTASVRVRRSGAEIAAGSAAIQDPAPGLFVIDPGDLERPGAIITQTGTAAGQNSIIEIYGTGQGIADPTPPPWSNRLGAGRGLVQRGQPEIPACGRSMRAFPTPSFRKGAGFVVVGSHASNAVTVKVDNSGRRI